MTKNSPKNSSKMLKWPKNSKKWPDNGQMAEKMSND